jgi:hypothetical protein
MRESDIGILAPRNDHGEFYMRTQFQYADFYTRAGIKGGIKRFRTLPRIRKLPLQASGQLAELKRAIGET